MFTEKYGSDTLDWVHLNWMYRMMAMHPKNTFQVVIYNTSLAIRFFESASPDIVSYVPLHHVTLGALVTTQAEADAKIPALLRCPAAKWFAVVEPTEAITFRYDTDICHCGDLLKDHKAYGSRSMGVPMQDTYLHDLSFIELRGSTGPDARPVHPQWARQIRDECKEAGVDFWLSGWREFGPEPSIISDGSHGQSAWRNNSQKHICERGEHVYRVGPHRSGRLLDGIEHTPNRKASNEQPATPRSRTGKKVLPTQPQAHQADRPVHNFRGGKSTWVSVPH
jgi:hypothetical protein